MAKQKKTTSIKVSQVDTSSSFFSGNNLYYLIVFVFSFALYFNSVFNDYNMDDELVTQNHRLTSKGISAIPEIFNSPYYEDKSGYKYEYRPMVLASFAIEHSFFGENPHISHLVNVLLYSFLCVLLFYLLMLHFGNYSVLFSLFVALLFAAHPIHTEVVASIKNRDEILGLLFALLAWLCAFKFVSGKNVVYLFLIPLSFIGGIFSKSTTIVFAVLIPLSLVLLTFSSFKKIFWVTLTLLPPAVFFARLYSVTQQAELTIGILLFVAGIYFISRAKLDFAEWKSRLSDLLQIFRTTEKEEAKAETTKSSFEFFKKPLVAVFVIVFVLAATFFSVAGIYSGNVWLSLVPLFFLSLAFIAGTNELRVVLLFPISAISQLALVKFKITATLIEPVFVALMLSQIISKEKFMRSMALLAYALYVFVAVFFLHSYFFLIGILIVGIVNKKLFPFVAGVAAIGSTLFLFFIGSLLLKGNGLGITLLRVPLVLLTILLLYKGKKKLVATLNTVFLPIIILLYFLAFPPAVNHEISKRVAATYHTLNTTKAADFTPVQAVRPLKFMEYPIKETDGWEIKIGTAMSVLGKYLKLIFIPYPLAFYYGYAYITPVSLFNNSPLLCFVIYSLLFVTGIAVSRKEKILAFAILFYSVSIIIFSGVVTPVPGMMADRFLFIPSLGFCIFLLWLVSKIQKEDWKISGFKSLKKSTQLLLVMIISFYAVLTFVRNFDWKNRLTLFSHDISAVENSAQAQNLLGLHLFIESGKENFDKQMQMRQEAVTHFEKALAIFPNFLNASFDLSRTYEAIANAYSAEKNIRSSQDFADKAYQQYARTIQIDSTFITPCFNMAIIQHNKGNVEAAIPLYERFLTKYPHRIEAYSNLSFAYFTRKDYKQSIAVNEKAIANNPEAIDPIINVAKTYMVMNEKDSALFYFRKANTLQPGRKELMQQIELLLPTATK